MNSEHQPAEPDVRLRAYDGHGGDTVCLVRVFPSQDQITNWFNDDFRSEHPGGENFVIGDISVRLVTGSIELVVVPGDVDTRRSGSCTGTVSRAPAYDRIVKTPIYVNRRNDC